MRPQQPPKAMKTIGKRQGPPKMSSCKNIRSPKIFFVGSGWPQPFLWQISRQYQEYQDKIHKNIKTFSGSQNLSGTVREPSNVVMALGTHKITHPHTSHRQTQTQTQNTHTHYTHYTHYTHTHTHFSNCNKSLFSGHFACVWIYV